MYLPNWGKDALSVSSINKDIGLFDSNHMQGIVKDVVCYLLVMTAPNDVTLKGLCLLALVGSFSQV